MPDSGLNDRTAARRPRNTAPRGTRLLLSLTLLLCLCPLAAHSQTPAPAGKPADNAAEVEALDPKARSYWRRYWQTVASGYVRFDDQFLCIRGYNPRYPNSRGVTVDDVLKQAGRTEIEAKSWQGTMRMTVSMPQEEAQLQAMALPDLTVGQYGWIYSLRVERVLGPQDMVVRELRLLDCDEVRRAREDQHKDLREKKGWELASKVVDYMYTLRDRECRGQSAFSEQNQLLRAQGFSTEGLATGSIWRGPRGRGVQVAIIGVTDTPGIGRTLILVPVEQLERGLDEDQFIQLLKERGLTIKAMADLIESQVRSRGSSNLRSTMIDVLEEAAAKSAAAGS